MPFLENGRWLREENKRAKHREPERVAYLEDGIQRRKTELETNRPDFVERENLDLIDHIRQIYGTSLAERFAMRLKLEQ
jgi:hypothetical protein